MQPAFAAFNPVQAPGFQQVPQPSPAPATAPGAASAASTNPFAAAASSNPFGGAAAIKEFKPKDPRAIMDDDDDTPLGFEPISKKK